MNTCKKEYDALTWEEIIFGVFIENAEISPDIMKSMDDDRESIMQYLDNK